LRLAIDIGIHRRKVYGTTLTPHNEMWKRAFWYAGALSEKPNEANHRNQDAVVG
jgi:hypothetical protein